jgi:hypothetical protein
MTNLMMPVIAHRARVTGDARDVLARAARARYEGGASIRAIAEESGRSYGAMHRLLTATGVRLRSRGGSRSRS